MDCEKIIPLLSAYIDKELSAEEMAVVEQHLPLCPDCARKLEESKAVAGAARSLGEVAPPAAFSQRLRKAVREKIQQTSYQSASAKPVPWWQKIAPKTALGLASAAAVIILLLFLNISQKTGTLTTSPPGVSEKAVPQYAVPRGNGSGEMGDLAERPKPQVKTTKNRYTQRDLERKLQALSVWKEFRKAYRVNDATRFQPIITRYLTEQATVQGEDPLSMIKSLSVALPPPNADFVALPSYLEKARFNHKKAWVDVWIIILNWQSKDQPEAFLERGRIYVVNAQTQEILFSTTF
jgi:hypothetical protein